MADSGFGYILDKWPWLFIIIVCVAVGIYIGKFINRFKKIESDCGKISDMEKSARIHEQTSLRIEKSIDERLLPSVEKSIDRIDTIVLSLNSLGVYLGQKDQGFDHSSIIKAKSPVQLTEMGQEILRLLGGDKYIDQNLEKLLSAFKEEKLKSALDVQNQAALILLDQSNTNEFVPIKNYIYHNPEYKKGDIVISLNINVAVLIMGIYLRNKYLEKHPELVKDAPDKKQS